MMGFSADTWLSIAALIISVATPLVIYLVRSTAKSEADDAVTSIQATQTDHAERLIRLEEGLKALPQQRDFRSLNETVSTISGDMKATTSEIRSLHEGLSRMERQLAIITETMMTRAP